MSGPRPKRICTERDRQQTGSMATTSGTEPTAEPSTGATTGMVIGAEEFPEELLIRENLYVREAYVDLYRLIKERIDVIKEHKTQLNEAIRVTGTPGMGKSYFLGYVWLQLTRNGVPVVATVGNKTIISREGGNYEDITSKMLDDFLTPDVVYLMDPRKGTPWPSPATTVIFVSPSIERIGDLKRHTLTNFYLPPWHKKELQDCVTKVYPRALEWFEERFEKWGGSLRNMVLSVVDSLNYSLESFLKNKCLIDIINEMDGDYLKKDLEHFQMFVHRIPIEEDGVVNYKECFCKFPTDDIGLKVADKIRTLKVDWKKVGNSILLGRAYESHVLKSLLKVSEDKYLPVKAIKAAPRTSVTVSIDVDAVKRHSLFTNKQKIDKPESFTLYVPVENNKAGVDFVMPPWLFQVTLRKEHDAKRLEKVLAQFKSERGEWKVCFIIPSVRLNEFVCPQLSSYPSIKETYKLPYNFGNLGVSEFDQT